MVYKIPEANYGILVERLAKLTRRAEKLGRAIPTVNIVNQYDEKVDGLVNRFFDVTIESEPICINGWTFVASIDITDDLEVGRVIRRVPNVLNDIDLPAEYRTTNNYCDQCGQNRRRISVFIVHNQSTGEWKQIGRNCLGLFLGGVDPKAVMQSMEILINLDGLCYGAQSYDYFGVNSRPRLDLENTLVFTAFVVKQHGWMSRTKAREFDKVATADIVREAYFGNSQSGRALINDFKYLESSERNALEFKVAESIDWIRGQNPEDLGDYMYNLHVVCHEDAIDSKHLGLAVSLLSAYENSLNQGKNKEKIESKHVGIVGQRQSFILTVKDIKYWSNNFGTTTAVFFNDADGNVFLWKASKDPDFDIGETYSLDAKLKAHSFYQNRAQNEISHAKISGKVGNLALTV